MGSQNKALDIWTFKNRLNKNKTNKILAIFFAFIGLMQLFDWIFWENQNISNQNEKLINFIFTKIAMFVNHLQPIVLAIVIYIYIIENWQMHQLLY